MDKKKIYKFTKKYVSAANTKIAILFIPLLIIIIKNIANGSFRLDILYDTSILVSFLIVFLCESIANTITWYVERWTEDDIKLDHNYKALVNKYSVDKSNMVQWKNKDGKTVYIPALKLYERNINSKPIEFSVEKDTCIHTYNLPKQIADNSATLFNAHSHSTTYNNINIRLNDLTIDNNKVKLLYGLTTYYDSLLTNRAMDYPFKGNRTVREVYEPGPFLSPLSKSKLSNHLGFNGFVELSDGNIIFVKRGNTLSVAKGMWQQSVGASLKTKYCMDSNHNLSEDGLGNAIKQEINDELKIKIDDSENLKKYIFAFYRDIVEGGKPQFLFYYKTNKYNKDSFIEEFNNALREKQANNSIPKRVVIDGKQFEFFTIEQLKSFTYDIDSMTDNNGNVYKMMPSSIASIILLLDNY